MRTTPLVLPDSVMERLRAERHVPSDPGSWGPSDRDDITEPIPVISAALAGEAEGTATRVAGSPADPEVDEDAEEAAEWADDPMPALAVRAAPAKPVTRRRTAKADVQKLRKRPRLAVVPDPVRPDPVPPAPVPLALVPPVPMPLESDTRDITEPIPVISPAVRTGTDSAAVRPPGAFPDDQPAAGYQEAPVQTEVRPLPDSAAQRDDAVEAAGVAAEVHPAAPAPGGHLQRLREWLDSPPGTPASQHMQEAQLLRPLFADSDTLEVLVASMRAASVYPKVPWWSRRSFVLATCVAALLVISVTAVLVAG
jgi:hypothetical protein